MTIKINLGEIEFDITELLEDLDPNNDVRIDQSDLNGEFLRQSKLAAAYGYLAAEAEKREKLLDYDLEVIAANLDKEVRCYFESVRQKVTEIKIRNEVITKKLYRDTKLKLIDARSTKQIFKATCFALNHKLQALINAGADHRKTFSEARLLEQE